MDLVIEGKAKLHPLMEVASEGELSSREFVLSLSCKDSKGVVFAVSGLLYQVGCNILDSQQFSDVEGMSGTGLFFMRVHFEAPPALADAITLSKMFSHVTERFGMYARFEPLDRRPKVLILVSKFSHCLNDLIFRQQTGQLPMEIAAVVSNHNDLRGMAERFGLPFHHLPLKTGASSEEKREQETKIQALVQDHAVDLVVLARYMQILSPELAGFLQGRAINIHHSFLPSFKGAKPYLQAFGRGVKLIGASAHYVTADLDEGPIIEQDVQRVDHTCGPTMLATLGRDVESQVLSRAVRWHLEHRVLINGGRTVVFK